MPIQDANSIVNLPIKYLIDTIAATATWQEWTNSSDDDFAAVYIYVEAADRKSDDFKYPLCVVSTPVSYETRTVGSGTLYTWQDSGAMQVLIEDIIPADFVGSEADAHIWFTNMLGDLIEDIQDLSGLDGYLNITNISYAKPPTRSSYDEGDIHDDYISVILRVEYGI